MIQTFTTENFHTLCDTLASQDRALRSILETHGYPPMWTRPNTFESLVHIILEQQVSLASALAALHKLKEKIKKITPDRLLSLTDDELKACYFSRQKMTYARLLAEAIQNKTFVLKAQEKLSDSDVRANVVALKGLGNWSADIYLMFVLRRVDIFPPGDLAAVNALKEVKKLPKDTDVETLLRLTKKWQPHRSVATMLLWHHYLASRKKPAATKEKLKKAVSL